MDIETTGHCLEVVEDWEQVCTLMGPAGFATFPGLPAEAEGVCVTLLSQTGVLAVAIIESIRPNHSGPCLGDLKTQLS